MRSTRFLLSLGLILIGFGWTLQKVADLWLHEDFDAAAARILTFAGISMMAIGLAAGTSGKSVGILAGISLFLVNGMSAPVVYRALEARFDAPVCLLLTTLSNLCVLSIPFIKGLSENLASRNQSVYIPELHKEDKYQNLLK